MSTYSFPFFFLLIFILSIFIFSIYQEQEDIEKIQEPFIDHLVLPPILAGRIRPFYRNNRKYYKEIYDKYTGLATRHLKRNNWM